LDFFYVQKLEKMLNRASNPLRKLSQSLLASALQKQRSTALVLCIAVAMSGSLNRYSP
jgi:hypothetical protein